MASLERRGGVYRIKFRFGGRQYGCSLKTDNERNAHGMLARLEESLQQVERGRLTIPETADLCRFLLTDGKLQQAPTAPRTTTLKQLFEGYRAGNLGKEANTRVTEQIHMGHLQRVLGVKRLLSDLTPAVLQDYVKTRSAEAGRRGGKVSRQTVKKEIGTFSAVWHQYAVPQGLASGSPPTKGLVYPKERSKELFQTWKQIASKIARGGLSKAQQAELWQCLFLDVTQVQQLLEHVKKTPGPPWFYPMVVFAAHTGARRSELLRSEVDDFDFEANLVRIREKKRDRSKHLTFRTVPISAELKVVVQDWLARHPGGQLTICEKPNIPITPLTAQYRLVHCLSGSKWEVLHGWHTLRHSFCSNCAAKGIDQRLISAWMGHMTKEMEERYRHLFPTQQQEALGRVFGEASSPSRESSALARLLLRESRCLKTLAGYLKHEGLSLSADGVAKLLREQLIRREVLEHLDSAASSGDERGRSM